MEQLKTNQKLYASNINLLAKAGSSTNIGSPETEQHYNYKTLGHSPTEQVALHNDKSRMILPNLSLTKQQFAFGATDGKTTEAISEAP